MRTWQSFKLSVEEPVSTTYRGDHRLQARLLE